MSDGAVAEQAAGIDAATAADLAGAAGAGGPGEPGSESAAVAQMFQATEPTSATAAAESDGAEAAPVAAPVPGEIRESLREASPDELDQLTGAELASLTDEEFEFVLDRMNEDGPPPRSGRVLNPVDLSRVDDVLALADVVGSMEPDEVLAEFDAAGYTSEQARAFLGELAEAAQTEAAARQVGVDAFADVWEGPANVAGALVGGLEEVLESGRAEAEQAAQAEREAERRQTALVELALRELPPGVEGIDRQALLARAEHVIELVRIENPGLRGPAAVFEALRRSVDELAPPDDLTEAARRFVARQESAVRPPSRHRPRNPVAERQAREAQLAAELAEENGRLGEPANEEEALQRLLKRGAAA